MIENDNPLLSKTQISKLLGISIALLIYYLKDFNGVNSPCFEIVGDRKFWRQQDILSWWQAVRQYQRDYKEARAKRYQASYAD